MEQKTKITGKELSGVVVSDKMQKTIVVKVDRYVKHPRFGKYYRTSKKYKVHDDSPANDRKYKIGDRVTIRETAPISKDKHFRVISKQAE